MLIKMQQTNPFLDVVRNEENDRGDGWYMIFGLLDN